jgi:hypothetical protein
MWELRLMSLHVYFICNFADFQLFSWKKKKLHEPLSRELPGLLTFILSNADDSVYVLVYCSRVPLLQGRHVSDRLHIRLHHRVPDLSAGEATACVRKCRYSTVRYSTVQYDTYPPTCLPSNNAISSATSLFSLLIETFFLFASACVNF